MGRPKLSEQNKNKKPWFHPFDESKKGKRIHWTPSKLHRLANEMMRYFEEHHQKVTISSFCWEAKIPPPYIGLFARRDPYFKYCLNVVKALLEERILEMGYTGEIDKVLAIFTLKNVAGWTDKKEVSNNIEITSKVVELALPKKRETIEVEAEIVEAKKLGKPENAEVKTPGGKSS